MMYESFRENTSWRWTMRLYMRDACVLLLSLPRRVDSTDGWIRFPYYHNVYDHDRRGFVRQLNYMKNYGDFISLDAAVSLLSSGDPIDARYFCITFDDGFKDCFTNALPILVQKEIPAAFLIPVTFIGSHMEMKPEPCLRRVRGPIEFLSWDDCKQMVAAGMLVGSHSLTHVNLIELGYEDIVKEMRDSKLKIEQELGQPCHHFCCPWGIPEVNFLADREPAIAKEIGYSSFLTNRRGAMHRGESPYLIRRDHTVASWGNYQLRYFLSL